MKAAARWLWRRIPAQRRYRLYHRIMNSSNIMIRGLLWFSSAATLRHHRFTVWKLWPEVRGLDHLALAAWAALIRFHASALRGMWRYGHLVRRWYRARPVDSGNRRVVHVTGSFDLGGTQTQIRNLCTAGGVRYSHAAVEVFPELNFLYRRDVRIDAQRYLGGGLLARTIGRLVVARNYRSSQLVQIYKLLRDFQAENPEVVVGWGHEMCVTTFIAAALARVPHIVFCIRTVNPDYGWVEQPFPVMLRRAHRRMLPMVSRVVVNSTLLQRDHAGWAGMARDEISVCANGIELVHMPADTAADARARLRAEHGIPDGTAVIVNVGRFSEEKGQRSIIQANRILLARGTAPPFMWLLAGDGPTMAEVRTSAEALGMTNIIFLGRTDRVQEVLCAGDIYVMPSDYEGMPNAMMEAMAAGLPCVSTNRSGATDVARPDREALYYEPGKALDLAIHLEFLLGHPEEARKLGRAAAARIAEFSVSRFVQAFEGVLDAVQGSSKGP